jgi:hypothetical protein
MMGRTLSGEDIAAIADAVAKRLLAPPALPRIAVSVDDIQAMLGAPSKWATHQQIKRLGLKPFLRGSYRLRDIDNAIARRTRV